MLVLIFSLNRIDFQKQLFKIYHSVRIKFDGNVKQSEISKLNESNLMNNGNVNKILFIILGRGRQLVTYLHPNIVITFFLYKINKVYIKILNYALKYFFIFSNLN